MALSAFSISVYSEFVKKGDALFMDNKERFGNGKLEGVFARGYGVVPRSIMLQSELSPEARALYAYYCVVSGNSGGYQSSPREELILKTMHISHTRFIKHRKTLTEAGLISFIQPKKETGKPLFETSKFLIIKAPRENTPALPDSAPLNALAAVQEGIFSEGFGLVPKMVLYDAELSVEAKAAYVFLCVFANADTRGSRSASLSSALIQEKLMTRKRVQHAFSELSEAGYIRRERLHNGAFAGIVYILNYEKSNGSQPSRIDTAKAATRKSSNDTAKDIKQESLFDTSVEQAETLMTSLYSSADTSGDNEGENATAKDSLASSLFETSEYEATNFEPPKNLTPFNNKGKRNRADNKYIYPSYRSKGNDEHARAKSFSEHKKDVEAQIEADVLSAQYGKEIMNAIVLVMADVYSADNGRIRINGRECDITQAAEVYKSLKPYHIEYVLEKIGQQGEIANIQNYLYSCLYNAAISCDLEIYKLSRR